jgi:hypothetical protein
MRLVAWLRDVLAVAGAVWFVGLVGWGIDDTTGRTLIVIGGGAQLLGGSIGLIAWLTRRRSDRHSEIGS